MERRVETLSARRDRMNRAAAQRLASDNRRRYWQAKAQEETRRAELDRAADMEMVSHWLSRFGAARNELCGKGV